MKRIFSGLILSMFITMAFAQTKLPAGWQSSYVNITPEGKIVYHPDKDGNTVPDFSRVGYHHGNKTIPNYPVTKTIYPAKDGDSGKLIQDAIDEVSRQSPDKNGHRGTILLTRGIYKIAGTIRITTGGVVLMGEGDHVNGTKLVATGKERRSLIKIEGSGKLQEIKGTRVKITDKFVPVGTHSFNVSSAKEFKPGDKVILYRPGTKNWITDIKMDQIVEREGTRQWQPEEYNLSFEREVTKVEGNRISIDNPVLMRMDEKYGGGEIYKYTFDGRINEIGITHIYMESEFNHYEDNQHGWVGVEFDLAENCWVSNVTTRYFGYASVSLEYGSKNVSVLDCKCLEPKSVITGGMRYSFNNCGQQNLFMNCTATEGRHDYVTGARVCGPNVFYNCIAMQTYADIGPHHRWAVGTLYDNIVTDGEINVQDRGKMGSGHGWAGVTQVLWNCRVRRAAVQNPWTSGNNYNFGMKGEKYPGHFTDRPDGIWEGHKELNVFPRSLYIAQLMARLGEDLTTLIK